MKSGYQSFWMWTAPFIVAFDTRKPPELEYVPVNYATKQPSLLLSDAPEVSESESRERQKCHKKEHQFISNTRFGAT